MYKYNSDVQWNSSTSPKSEMVGLSLHQEEADSDIVALEKQRANTVNGEANSNQNVTKTLPELQFELLLSNLLKYGVIFASTVVLYGGILYLIRHGHEPAGYHIFRGEPFEFSSPIGVVQAVRSRNPGGIIQFGLLLLVAIPIVRVIISVFAFLRQRDFIYAVITLSVLTALIYSLVTAYY